MKQVNWFKSIFEDPKVQNPGLWFKRARDFIDRDDILFDFDGAKAIDTAGGVFKYRTFFVTDKCIFYEKSTDYWFPLRIVTFENLMANFAIESSASPSEFKYKLFLSVQNSYTTIGLNLRRSFESLITHLKPRVPFLDFHDKFISKSLIEISDTCTVFHAVHKDTGENFRVKSYSKDFLKSRLQGVTQVRNEIRMGFVVKQDCAPVNCFYESQNTIYVLFEMYQWTTLQTILDYRQLFDARVIKHIFLNLVRIVWYLEAKYHVVHKDIKPFSIAFKDLLLKKAVRGQFDRESSEFDVRGIDLTKYEVLLIDYGIATLHEEEENPLTSYFHLGYSAPEFLDTSFDMQLTNNKSDAYSVAAVIVELITGEPVVHSEDMDATFTKNIRGIQLEREAQMSAQQHESATQADLKPKRVVTYAELVKRKFSLEAAKTKARFPVEPAIWELLEKMLSPVDTRIPVSSILHEKYFAEGAYSKDAHRIIEEFKNLNENYFMSGRKGSLLRKSSYGLSQNFVDDPDDLKFWDSVADIKFTPKPPRFDDDASPVKSNRVVELGHKPIAEFSKKSFLDVDAFRNQNTSLERAATERAVIDREVYSTKSAKSEAKIGDEMHSIGELSIE